MHSLITLVVALLAVPSALAQSWSLLYTLDATLVGPDTEFGYALASVGDLDGDGTDDLAVTALVPVSLPDPVRVYLYSGADGTPIDSLGSIYSAFGLAMTRLDDRDGDGVTDFLVASSGERVGDTQGAGRVYVHSGATRDTLSTSVSPSPMPSRRFGLAVASLGDVDGDDVGDYAVSERERVYVFSGATGDTLRTHRSPNPRTDAPGRFGAALAAVADLDGDGAREIAVLASSENPAPFRTGRLYTFSGATGTLLRTLNNPGSSWNEAVLAEAGDLTGDGIPDLLLGAREGANGGDKPTTFLGRLYVVSGASGQIARTVVSPNENGDGYSGSSFATAVAAITDADGMGGAGFAAGEPRWASGRVHVFTAGGALVQPLENPADSDPAWAASRFGQSLAALRSSDGSERLAVASSDYSAAQESDGRVYVYGRLPVASAPSAPMPRLAVSVSPNPVRSSATFTLTLGEASSVAITVVDALGRVVRRVEAGALAAGAHRLALDVRGLPSGVYVVRAETTEATSTARITVAR